MQELNHDVFNKYYINILNINFYYITYSKNIKKSIISQRYNYTILSKDKLNLTRMILIMKLISNFI